MSASSSPEPEVPARAEGDFVEEMPLDEQGATRRLRNGLISLVLLVVLVIGLLLAVPGLNGVAHLITHIPASYVVAAVALEVLSCLGYVLAFLQVFDRAPIRFGARVALSELAFGAAVSLGGAGSVAIGALLLVERGGSPSRVAERSAVLFLLTSAVNVITLALAGLALWMGILPGPSDFLLSGLPGLVAAAVFLLFLILPEVSDRLVGDRPGKIAIGVRETARVTRWTRRLLFSRDWRLVGAFGFLWFDIAVLAVCFAAVGPVPPLAVIVLAYQIAYMSNLLPIPGNVGVLDGSFVGMFVLYGVSATEATAATVVYHAIALWIPAMWGTVAFLLLRRSRGQPLQLRPPREERRASRLARRRG
jgi:uncharacterized membrane protein YbhN (UPF0104 family)